ncbi:LamG-like jellyroll fold domain-containing protein [Candidatus Poribacteria bacterium]
MKNLVLACMAFAVVGLVLSGVSNAIIEAGAVEGLWLFNDGAGNVLRDSSDHKRHGEVLGGAEWTNDGKFGGGMVFDGVDDDVVITGYKGIGGTDPRTTVMWYKTTKPGDHRLVCWGNNATANKYHTRLHDTNTLRVETQGGQLFANGPDLADGNWHHLAIVLPPGSTMCHDHLLYVDGVEITDRGGNDVGVDTIVDTHDVEIGYNLGIGHGSYAEGTIDEVAIFNVALSGDDILEIFSNGLANSTTAVEPSGKLATTWGDVRAGY